MSLASGTKLGPYEILTPLGAGGMGEVYKAKDTRLDRTVAIKVLPSHLSDNARLKERFEREARAVSSLNHPHICTLHDIGSENGVDFMVMEHIEGETLADRLRKGALPLDQALRYAIEVADALDKAHRQGVVHRDLKPGNIMLTKSGAKLLDFGLAKLATSEDAPVESALPTQQRNLTAEGSILGTFQYMAPEQLEGKEADSRTDIFAFGAVLYEMVTGRRAFEGKSQASLISAIMTSDPPAMSTLQTMAPPLLDHVVKTCLAKDPDDRWQSASDIMRELKWIAEAGAAARVTSAAQASKRISHRSLGVGVGLGTLIGALAVGVIVWNPPSFLHSSVSSPVTRFTLALPQDDGPQPLVLAPPLAISPDGTQIAYVASSQLYVRAMNELEARPIQDTRDAMGPVFSADGQSVAFFADGKLKKVSINGGAVTTLCDVLTPHGASWDTDDNIMFGKGGAGIWQVPAVGGTPQVVVEPDPENVEVYGSSPPQLLPGGEELLYSAYTGSWDEAKVIVQRLGTGERKVVVEGGHHARYVESGHLVYVQGTSLLAVPFDSERLEVTGAPVPVVEGLMTLGAYSTGAGYFSLSTNGSLIYVPRGEGTAEGTLVWVDRTGAAEPLAAPPRLYWHPRLSPDGQKVAVTIGPHPEGDVYVYDIPRSTSTRLTFEGNNVLPVWTRDGERVTFASDRAGGPRSVYWKPADGTGAAERLTTGPYIQQPLDWSPSGRVLAFLELHPTNLPDILLLSLEGEGAPERFFESPFNEGGAMFSPDGHWVAYHSNELGRTEVFVRPFPDTGGRWQVSTEGGTEPVWAQDGRELFYRNGNKVMAVDIITDGSFGTGNPKLLFEGRYGRDNVHRTFYDVTPNGQRFLMVKESGQPETVTQINVVLNWFEELKRLVPSN